MSTSAREFENRPVKLNPTPHYPDIVLALNFASLNPPQFHWLLFVPAPGQDGKEVQSGTRVHVIQLLERKDGNVTRPWQFQERPFTLATSVTIAAAAVIGQLKDKTVEQLIHLLKDIPMDVPDVDRGRESAFTCRVWIREALRHLHGAGFIHCPDVDAMENEMLEYGLPAANAVSNKTFRSARLAIARNSRTL